MDRPSFPYGVSNFATLVEGNYVYVDRTAHIAALERLSSRYHIFLRPRRFGKSLFLSVLEHYYGREYRDEFEVLFGKYYIGQHPTPRANRYLVLKFDFSAVLTKSPEHLLEEFTRRVKRQTLAFLLKYHGQISENSLKRVTDARFPHQVIDEALGLVQQYLPGEQLFVLVDEYDHFTNELVAFYLKDFQAVVSQNGYVRKFYENVKKGTQMGIIDRIFITGVSPITLDSLTSDFNIADNPTLDLRLHHLMCLREEEVSPFRHLAGDPGPQKLRILCDSRTLDIGHQS